jgi:activating signal cointegrator 1
MKALTLTQPWATLVAIGAKKIETRSWNTNYRGPLAIHAAKGFPNEAKAMCLAAYFTIALDAVGMGNHRNLPLGAVIATCNLAHVMKVKNITASSETSFLWHEHWWDLDQKERAFGDYSVGRYMWLLDNIAMFPKPIPAKGALGLWNWGTE